MLIWNNLIMRFFKNKKHNKELLNPYYFSLITFSFQDRIIIVLIKAREYLKFSKTTQVTRNNVLFFMDVFKMKNPY